MCAALPPGVSLLDPLCPLLHESVPAWMKRADRVKRAVQQDVCVPGWSSVVSCFWTAFVSQKTLRDQHKSLNSFALGNNLLTAFSSSSRVGSCQVWPPLTGGGKAVSLPFVIRDEQPELVGAPPWV